MDTPSKKRTAQLLLGSLLLESCYNPNLGTGKKTLPAPVDPTYQQHQYEQKPHDKPTSLTLTTADHHPIQFTYHPSQPQAVVRSQAQPRATSQPLPSPSREAPRQQRVQHKDDRQLPRGRIFPLMSYYAAQALPRPSERSGQPGPSQRTNGHK